MKIYRFQPNKEIGQILYESTRIKYLLQSNTNKQKTVQNQFYLDPVSSKSMLIIQSLENQEKEKQEEIHNNNN